MQTRAQAQAAALAAAAAQAVASVQPVVVNVPPAPPPANNATAPLQSADSWGSTLTPTSSFASDAGSTTSQSNGFNLPSISEGEEVEDDDFGNDEITPNFISRASRFGVPHFAPAGRSLQTPVHSQSNHYPPEVLRAPRKSGRFGNQPSEEVQRAAQLLRDSEVSRGIGRLTRTGTLLLQHPSQHVSYSAFGPGGAGVGADIFLPDNQPFLINTAPELRSPGGPLLAKSARSSSKRSPDDAHSLFSLLVNANAKLQALPAQVNPIIAQYRNVLDLAMLAIFYISGSLQEPGPYPNWSFAPQQTSDPPYGAVDGEDFTHELDMGSDDSESESESESESDSDSSGWSVFVVIATPFLLSFSFERCGASKAATFRAPSTSSLEPTPTPPHRSPTPSLPHALLVLPPPLLPPTPAPIAPSLSPSPATQLYHSFPNIAEMSRPASPTHSEPMEHAPSPIDTPAPFYLPTPAPRSHITSKITLAATPPHFDGVDKSKWDTWRDALKNFMWAYGGPLKIPLEDRSEDFRNLSSNGTFWGPAYGKEFATPKAKIAFTISLLDSKDAAPTPASNWVRNWRRRVLEGDDEELPHNYSFKNFLDDLSRTFKDQNVRQTAYIRLTTTRQGKLTLADFIQVFKLNTEEAGYNPHNEYGDHDQFLCENLENLVNLEVRTQLYAGGIEIPEDYLGLKRRMMTIGRVLECQKLRDAQQKHNTGTPFWVPAKILVAPAGNTRGTTPNLAKKLAPGETAPMNIDASQTKAVAFKCYNCGKEGHMAQECPQARRECHALIPIST
ncbi:hypothetical protein DFH09DRAFT_1307207 [Mycena vulgaris]|nr:hypothetical protein DFH09DRAFT_1307207 [Mycena vulgaris]